MKTKVMALAALSVAVSTGFAHASTLEKVRSAGVLACGVSEGVPGFSNPNSQGEWEGLDADICRAVAAAVLGDASAVRFVPLASKQKILAVSSGQVEMTSRTTSWTMKRDGAEGVDFTQVVFYDGQGFMVKAESGITSPLGLDGGTVCVTTGTTTELNLADYARAQNVQIEAVVFDGKREAVAAYLEDRCDAITTDASQLASFRMSLPDPEVHTILPDMISKEPLAPLVAHGDNNWKDIVSWTVYGLLGSSIDTGEFVGLGPTWMKDAISAVGNYGEIYDRNLTQVLGIERGLNAQWNDGGLMYAMPIR